MVRIAIFTFIAAIVALPARGQTTQPTEKPATVTPAEPAWPMAVESLAKALAKGDVHEVESMLSIRVAMHSFDSQQTIEAGGLVDRLAKSTLVGQHAYTRPPLAMAADIAADFKNTASISDKAKARFLVDDESDMKRANATAVQWVVEQLGARANVPIGVIILWTPRPVPIGSAEPDATVYDAVFVLCRGEEVAPREYKFTTVIFGNPVPQTNP